MAEVKNNKNVSTEHSVSTGTSAKGNPVTVYSNNTKTTYHIDRKNVLKFDINSWLSVLIVFILLTVLLRSITRGVVPSFTGFLEFFSNLQIFQVDWSFIKPIKFGDWGFFNWFRDFLTIFLELGNVILYLANGALALIQYVIAFMRFLFVM